MKLLVMLFLLFCSILLTTCGRAAYQNYNSLLQLKKGENIDSLSRTMGLLNWKLGMTTKKVVKFKSNKEDYKFIAYEVGTHINLVDSLVDNGMKSYPVNKNTFNKEAHTNNFERKSVEVIVREDIILVFKNDKLYNWGFLYEFLNNQDEKLVALGEAMKEMLYNPLKEKD